MNATGARAAIALVQVLGLAVWFSATAVGPALRAEWGLGSTTAVWLTCSVQLGFAAGAVGAAVLTLADRIPPHRLLALSATGASACTLLCTVADGAVTAIALRALTGVFLAGVYPVGMKLMTSWSGPQRRARDLGTLVAALALGSALPHLVLAGPPLPWRAVLAVAAVSGFLAAATALLVVRPGPVAAPAPPPDPRYAMRLLREPGPRLVVLGYLGHMWELYALWTWLGSYLASGPLAGRSEVLVFLTVGLGGALGCVAGGRAADRWGRVPTIVASLVVSGTCCLLSPLAAAAPPVVTGLFCLVWATAAVADSPVLTTATIEVADRRYTGTALTVQTALGFLLTVASIQLVPVLAAAIGWPAALAVLALGPAAATVAMVRLGRRVGLDGVARHAAAGPVGPATSAGAGGGTDCGTEARPSGDRASVGAGTAADRANVPLDGQPGSSGTLWLPGPPQRAAGSPHGAEWDVVAAGRSPAADPGAAGRAGDRAVGSPSAHRFEDDTDTVELYRLRRGGVPVEVGFAGDAARALNARVRAGRPGDPAGRGRATGPDERRTGVQ